MDPARHAGNADSISELEAIAPYANPGQIVPIKDLYIQRKWVGFYGGVMAYRRDNSADSALARLSPRYNDPQVPRIWGGNGFPTPYSLPPLLAPDPTPTHKLRV